MRYPQEARLERRGACRVCAKTVPQLCYRCFQCKELCCLATCKKVALSLLEGKLAPPTAATNDEMANLAATSMQRNGPRRNSSVHTLGEPP